MKTADAIIQEEFDDPHARVVAGIFRIHSHMLTEQNKLFKASGITAGEYHVLKILSGESSTVSVSSIQERMINKMSNTSRLVEKLNRKGLADRAPCPTDRRQVDVYITAQGLQKLEDLENDILQLTKSMVHLSPGEVGLLNDLLERLRS